MAAGSGSGRTTTVSATRFIDDARSHGSSEIGSAVSGVAVHNNDLRDEGRQIRKHAANGLRFIMGWDYAGYSHVVC